MSGALEDAERLLQEGLAPVEDVLETYGASIVRSGELPELIELVEATSPSGRLAVAQWIRSADLSNGGPPPESVADGPELDLVDAAEVLADPEKLCRPEEVIPHMVPRRSLTLVSGRPNVAGKTSILVAGCNSVTTGGRFLGKPAPEGTVLWCMAEGDERHIGRYLAQIEADPPPGRFRILRTGTRPLEEFESAVSMLEPDAVVVDSLGTFLAPLDVDLYTEEVVAPLRRIERVARSGPGVGMIHHPRKADDDPAGSHKIVAVSDLVRTIQEGRHDRERVMDGNGRWRLPEIRWQMKVTGDHPEVPDLESVQFQRIDEEREVEEKVIDFLDVHEPATKRSIRQGVDARAPEIDRALQELEPEVVEVDRSGAAHLHRLTR